MLSPARPRTRSGQWGREGSRMHTSRSAVTRAAAGLQALRAAVLRLGLQPCPAGADPALDSWLLSLADRPGGRSPSGGGADSDPATGSRIAALVELAQHGDAEAFGQLYLNYADL